MSNFVATQVDTADMTLLERFPFMLDRIRMM